MKKNILALMSTTLFMTSANAVIPGNGLTAGLPGKLSEANAKLRLEIPHQNGEKCIVLSKLPMAKYRQNDNREELKLCELNFYNNSTALCPKVWSTSPATIINSFAKNEKSPGVPYTTSAEAEAQLCTLRKPMKSLAKFKQTMNQSAAKVGETDDGKAIYNGSTSGTFSGASILYYHLSRAIDASVNVPVAVYRTMNIETHKTRVVSKANPGSNAKMNAAGWDWLSFAEKSPATYSANKDLFTDNNTQVYGVLLKDKGERYEEEINGSRAGGWGEGQNFSFQKTRPFLALKEDKSLIDSINEHKGNVSVPQMVMWMNELSEIAILDHIMNQQDRVGNIDYEWKWSYVDAEGKVRGEDVDDQYKDYPRSRMSKIPVSASLAGRTDIKNLTLVQVTQLGDNDAGGLPQYANFSKKTGMLAGIESSKGRSEPLRHINPEVYNRVLQLASDLQSKGPNYQVLDREFRIIGLNDSKDLRFNRIVLNTIEVAKILHDNCVSGVLKLDLVSFKKSLKGILADQIPTSCEIQ